MVMGAGNPAASVVVAWRRFLLGAGRSAHLRGRPTEHRAAGKRCVSGRLGRPSHATKAVLAGLRSGSVRSARYWNGDDWTARIEHLTSRTKQRWTCCGRIGVGGSSRTFAPTCAHSFRLGNNC
jgi:hypothetical protein